MEFVSQARIPSEAWILSGICRGRLKPGVGSPLAWAPRALLGRFGFAGHGHKADRQHGMILDYSA